MSNCFISNGPLPAFLVAGPTASGKTALTHALARDLRLEIVSADSMQVYRGVTIATAAPSEALRREVTYHLVEMEELESMYSAGRFLRDAVPLLQRCAAAGRPALVTGGTGLYLRVMVEGLIGFREGAADDDTARHGGGRATPLPAEAAALHEELRALDPAAAQAIHPHNVVRVRRALELIRAAGRPLAEAWREDRATSAAPARALLSYVLERDRDDLLARIGRRTRLMWAEGVAAEVAALRERLARAGRSVEDCPAGRALGLGLIARGLESGEVRADDRPAADAPLPPRLAPYVEAMERTTRRYAKRQMTWLRKYARTATWINLTRTGEEAAFERMRSEMRAALEGSG